MRMIVKLSCITAVLVFFCACKSKDYASEEDIANLYDPVFDSLILYEETVTVYSVNYQTENLSFTNPSDSASSILSLFSNKKNSKRDIVYYQPENQGFFMAEDGVKETKVTKFKRQLQDMISVLLRDKKKMESFAEVVKDHYKDDSTKLKPIKKNYDNMQKASGKYIDKIVAYLDINFKPVFTQNDLIKEDIENELKQVYKSYNFFVKQARVPNTKHYEVEGIASMFDFKFVQLEKSGDVQAATETVFGFINFMIEPFKKIKDKKRLTIKTAIEQQKIRDWDLIVPVPLKIVELAKSTLKADSIEFIE